jgi:hypothetical protein
MVTVCAVVYDPAPGENVGAGRTRLMVYASVVVAEFVKPASVAITFTVSEVLTVIGPV